ncbi:hypothetical protein BU16DRAFT_562745 [Lophium mytilinum]|uniref:F-box domain-containing protein n=1 Tax=Lophium mytilinum TaxID=390894 RepID=A0A6A6QNS4_9PEZI|nr:hypothetical protein BU16DRAFT_562745 [Lophium mytilinum]
MRLRSSRDVSVYQPSRKVPQRSLKLNELPVEIIQHIASLGPCESTLTLLQVSRYIHNICNHWTTFRNIIEHQVSLAGQKWDYSTFLDNESELQLWKNFALAASRSSELHDFIHEIIPSDNQMTQTTNLESRHGHIERILKWGPSLAARHYPMHDDNTLRLVYHNTEWPVAYKYPFQFCITASVLSTLNKSAPSTTKLLELREKEVCNIKSASWMIPLLHQLTDLATSYQPSQRHFPVVLASLLLKVVAAVAVEFAKLSVSLLGQTLPRSFPPLNYEAIPLSVFMDIPSPFAPGNGPDLISRHLPMMATKRFLEDGKWIGFICNIPLDPHGTQRAPTMHHLFKVQFEVSAGSDDDSLQLVSSRAEDDADEFWLEGSVFPSTGFVVLVKRYITNSKRGGFCGRMTPFGMAGTAFGAPNELCCFWMYKVSWMA